jgi:hypothetical protein
MTGNLSFGDNDKAIFGAGSDLQIYHQTTGTTGSFISDVGAGNLFIEANNLRIRDTSENLYIFGNSGEEVQLYYAGTKKLETSSTGAEVFGTLTSDGLTVARAGGSVGSSNVAYIDVTSSYGGLSINASTGNNAFIELMENGVKTAGFNSDATNNVTSVQSANSHALAFNTGSTNERMRITDDGLVGIGTSSPNQSLVVADGSGSTAVVIDNLRSNVGDTSSLIFRHNVIAGSQIKSEALEDFSVSANRTSDLQFWTRNNGTILEAMRIASDGSVGIGTSSPSQKLEVSDTTNQNVVVRVTNNDGNAEMQKYQDDLYLNLNDTGNIIVRSGSPIAERIRIDSSGRVMIAETSNSGYSGNADDLIVGDNGSATERGISLGSTLASTIRFNDGSDAGTIEYAHSDNSMRFGTTNGTERMRIDSSGNLLVGRTSSSGTAEGIRLLNDGFGGFHRDSAEVIQVDRKTDDGVLISLRKDGSEVGSIGSEGSGARLYINQGDTGIGMQSSIDSVIPVSSNGGARDNAVDLGYSSVRFDDIYATNGTIQTSDQNEKQDIAELSDAEQRVAVAAKGLLRKFRWKDAVAEKGDEARTHFGIIAQDLQAAFAAEGLNAGDYAMFIHTTWTDEETGEERSRMGVRYSELLAFIIAAI